MDKSKLDILCDYLNNNVAERYPIKNDDLANSTDYIKNGYLKMLAVVLQQAEDISASQINVFRRIIEGAETDKTAEDFLRMALEIEVEDYIEFTNECKELSLKYRWVLDILILTYVRKQDIKQVTLVAQFCESLEISKNELKYIATMAGAIISMNEADCVTAYEIKEESIPDNVFSDYWIYVITRT